MTGHAYYFCSPRCLGKFTAEPERYLKPAAAAATPAAAAGTIYTCPMHPQIRQVGPGTCPICGMALEPEMVDRRERPQSRTRRHDAAVLDRAGAGGCRWSSLEMGGHLFDLHTLIGAETSNWLQFAARHAGRAVGRLAVLRARLAVARHAQPQHVHPDRHGHRRRLGLQRRRDRSRPASSRRPSAAADGSVAGLFRGGGGDHRAGAARPGAGAARARARRRGAIRALLDLAPKTRAAARGRRQRTRRCRSTPSRSATGCGCGRARRCRSTAIVIEGRSSLDESMVTGESMPVTKERGAKVIGGTINHDRQPRDARREGRPRHPARRASSRWSPTAQRSRAPIQRLADQVSGWFVPAVIAVAARRLRRLGDVRAGAAASPTGWWRRSRC